MGDQLDEQGAVFFKDTDPFAEMALVISVKYEYLIPQRDRL